MVQVCTTTWARSWEGYTKRMATDFDSAGVYFLSVGEFEWRPGQDNPDGSAKKTSQTAEAERAGRSAGEQPKTTAGKASPLPAVRDQL